MLNDCASFLYKFERFIRGPGEFLVKDYSRTAANLASFPKSGNTWLRFVLSNFASLNERGIKVNFPTIDNYAQVIRGNTSLTRMRSVAAIHVFLKSHSVHVTGFKKYKNVMIVRNPFKAISSYRNFLTNARGRNHLSIEEFCRYSRYCFNAWKSFIVSWDQKETIFVKCKVLVCQPLIGIQSIYNVLNVEVNLDIIKDAIDMPSRENMRTTMSIDDDPPNHNNYVFLLDSNEKFGIRGTFDDKLLVKYFPFFCKRAIQHEYVSVGSNINVKDITDGSK